MIAPWLDLDEATQLAAQLVDAIERARGGD